MEKQFPIAQAPVTEIDNEAANAALPTKQNHIVDPKILVAGVFPPLDENGEVVGSVMAQPGAVAAPGA